jgi:tetratricopeptide (TPR) repeat protein
MYSAGTEDFLDFLDMPHLPPSGAGSLKGHIVLPTPHSLFSCVVNVRVWGVALAAILTMGAALAPAQEPVFAKDKKSREQPVLDFGTQFLAKLRERGWHDVVLEYLERAKEDPLATPEFLDDVGYQMAVTRADLARQAVGDKERQSLQEQAIAGFEKYAQEHPDSKNSIAALNQVSNMLAEQALVILNKSDRLPDEAVSEQKILRGQARETIDNASAIAEQLLISIDKWLETLPRGAALQADKAAAAFKQDLLSKQAEARFLASNLNYEKARTFSPGSSEHKQALSTAAADFKRLQKEYENKLIGFYAVLYEGRCYQSSGNYKKALDTYGELIDQPVNQADFRKLIARAYRHRAECYLANNDIDKAIEECEDWLGDSRGDELSEPEWLAVQYRLAEAYAQKAESKAGGGNVSRLRTEARKLFRDVIKHPGEFQDDARAALALSGSENLPLGDVKGFAAALQAGKTALEQMGSVQLAVKLAASNNPAAVTELQEQIAASRASALKYFEQAVESIDDKTPATEAVAARYYLCWLYWEAGRAKEAAALGEQIVENHADSPFAVTAAKVTLAAYERIYLEAREAGVPNDIAASSQQLRKIAEIVADRWDGSEVATTASNLLISLALRENNFDEADRLLANLPESSRGAAGLSLGTTLWSQYLQQVAANKGESSPATNDLKARATKLLAGGYEAISSAKDASPAQAAGVLYYVQALLAGGAAEKALEVLENKQVGPLAVMKHGGGDEKDRAFAIETTKAALRAYVSVDPPQRDNAVAMMEQLESLAGDSPEAQQQLTAIYVNLGLQLQEQIKQLSSTGNDAKAQRTAAAFASLLNRVAKRGDSQSWAVRNWLAQTSLQLGSGLTGPEANRYFKQAEDAYRNILATAEKDPKFAPSELAVLAVHKKLGETLQSRGEFAGALDEYVAILSKKPSMLEIQQAAAEVLQAWGDAQKDAKTLNLSIHGTKPAAGGKNLVWGWLRLAEVADFAKRKAESGEQTPESTAAAQKYEDVYFTARLEAAKARFGAAKLSQGDDKVRQLATVRQSIVALKQLYPNLGGTRWQALFDALLKEVDAQSLEGGK